MIVVDTEGIMVSFTLGKEDAKDFSVETHIHRFDQCEWGRTDM